MVQAVGHCACGKVDGEVPFQGIVAAQDTLRKEISISLIRSESTLLEGIRVNARCLILVKAKAAADAWVLT
jgi:hypothetical protein